MTTTTLATQTADQAALMEKVLLGGDLSQLNPAQRVSYYNSVCESVGLNPLTKPFDYLKLDGKLVLYARKDATEQLRKLHGISIIDVQRSVYSDVLLIQVTVSAKDGRKDTDIGAVSIKGLQGKALANAMMKAITKGKRRATLSIAGLGWLDESELDTMDNYAGVTVDHDTGEIVTAAKVEGNGSKWQHQDIWGGWSSKDDALHWACTSQVMAGVFKHENHANNALLKLRRDLAEGLAEDEKLTAGIMWDAWVNDCYRRRDEAQANGDAQKNLASQDAVSNHADVGGAEVNVTVQEPTHDVDTDGPDPLDDPATQQAIDAEWEAMMGDAAHGMSNYRQEESF